MNTSAHAVRFDDDNMRGDLADGRILAVPLARFSRLREATAQQREAVEISARGLHLESRAEDISIDGLLAGRGDMTRTARPPPA